MNTLCDSCVHVREVISGRGSKFWLCRLSGSDRRFPKYPPQPVFSCVGFQRQSEFPMTLELLPGGYAICRLDPDSSIPEWVIGDFQSVTRTQHELSIVCAADQVPESIPSERDWKCIRIAGKLDFALVGVISALTKVLADAGISVFVISTFDTDYAMVKQDDLDSTVSSLRKAGYSVHV